MGAQQFCEIQVRQKGAWQRWIRFKPHAPEGAINASWGAFCGGRAAGRLVRITDDRVSVIASKKRGAV